MKKGDFLVIFLILLISGLVAFFNTKNFMEKDTSGGKKVVISVDGKVFKEVELNKNTDKIIKIDNKFGHNEIIIKNERVFMEESDCKDKICLHMGKIYRVGDTIICLPHRLLVKIVADDNKGLDVVLKWRRGKLFFYHF